MERTIETRWWVAGRLPDDVLTWFLDRAPATEEHRTDHYLVRPAWPEAGIKSRSGDRLELKVRTGRQDGVPLGHGAGHVEWWSKWSFGLRAEEPTDPLVAPNWLEVDKRRWVQDHDGCQVEFAVVNIDGGHGWWSLGLEGPADVFRAADLDQMLAKLFAVTPPQPIPLEPTMSRGYAEHLCSIG